MRNKTELGLYAWVVVIKTKFFKFKIIDYSENIYIYIYIYINLPNGIFCLYAILRLSSHTLLRVYKEKILM